MLAQLVILDLDSATVGTVDFFNKPTVGHRGWGLSARGGGVTKVFWTGLTVGLELLKGGGWEVWVTGFWVGRMGFVSERASVFWVR